MNRYAEKRMRFALRLLLVLLTGALFFSRDGWTQGLENCHIRILTTSRLGEKQRIVFKTRLGSKRECQKLARLHVPNFEPDRITRKEVAFKWTASPLSRR